MDYSYHFYGNQTIIDAKGVIVLNEDSIFMTWFLQASSNMGGRKVSGIRLDSPGGDAEAAISFGQNIIENFKLNTFVADGGTCASACAVLWASGKQRFASSNSHIGVHQTSRKRPAEEFGHSAEEFYTNNEPESGSITILETDRVGEYLRTRGAPEMVWLFNIQRTPPDQMYWLTPLEIAEWKTIPIENRPHF